MVIVTLFSYYPLLHCLQHSQFHLTQTRHEMTLAVQTEEAEGKQGGAPGPHHPKSSPIGHKITWKQRCELSLKDGRRSFLTGPEELASLVFDFRFRTKPECLLRWESLTLNTMIKTSLLNPGECSDLCLIYDKTQDLSGVTVVCLLIYRYDSTTPPF